jgi:hypothetical protein
MISSTILTQGRRKVKDELERTDQVVNQFQAALKRWLPPCIVLGYYYRVGARGYWTKGEVLKGRIEPPYDIEVIATLKRRDEAEVAEQGYSPPYYSIWMNSPANDAPSVWGANTALIYAGKILYAAFKGMEAIEVGRLYDACWRGAGYDEVRMLRDSLFLPEYRDIIRALRACKVESKGMKWDE